MSAVFLGGVSLGEQIPGVFVVLGEMGALIQTAITTLREQIGAIQTAKFEIRIPAVLDLQAQLDAALDFQAAFGIQISNPFGFVQDLLAGVAQIEQAISEIGLPEVALQAELDASLAVSLSLQLKIDLIDIKLGLLDLIAQLLQALLDAAQTTLDLYTRLAGLLAQAGAYSFYYEGPLGALGSSLDAVTAQSGVSASSPVTACVVVVPDTEAACRDALRLTFKVPA